MLKRLLCLLCLLVAAPAFAAHTLSPKAGDALYALGECAPTADTSCVMAGTCTQQNFCAACSVVDKAKPKQCHDKSAAFAAVEGLFTQLEGACGTVCSVSRSAPALASQGHKAGDQVVVVQKYSATGSALAAVTGSSGQVSLAMIKYGGVEKAPGTIIAAADDSISPDIANVTGCMKAKAPAGVKACFTSPGKCNEKVVSKSTKCSVCSVAKQCDDGEAYVGALFSFDCYGCK